MLSEIDYKIIAAIVRGPLADEWDELRVSKGEWPPETAEWKAFRNYTMQELKDALRGK